MLEPTVIMLDFDGTLVESVGVKDRAFEALYADFPEYLDDIMAYHVANNAVLRFEKFRHIATNILGQPFGEEEKAYYSARFHDLVFRAIVDCPAVEGSIAFLNHFNKRVPLYLISMTPDEELEEILKARSMVGYFKGIYAGSWKKRGGCPR